MGNGLEPRSKPSPARKSRKISDRLSEVAKSSFVGRENELYLLRDAIQADDPPFVVGFVHGLGGIGKSRLLHAALDSVGPDVSKHVLDCRDVEPTPPGLIAALARSVGSQGSEPDLDSIVGRFGELPGRAVLVFDTYETFGLMDTWLRQEFFPSLPENVLTIIAGRQAPNPAWHTTPGWQGLFREIPLREFTENDALKMLLSRGLTLQQAERVQHFAHGHPLALELGAAVVRSHPDLEVSHGPPPKVIQQLTGAFLAGLPAETMEAVEAASTVRRVTEPLLRVLLDLPAVRGAFSALEKLPFVDASDNGLTFHDVVRETIAKDLARRDAGRYRTYRRRAWRFFARESHEAVCQGLWQCTADMLYLIENPVVREAFFPEGANAYRVEPATDADAKAILDIAAGVEAAESAQWIQNWWGKHPATFSVAKDREGRVVAFYFLFEPVNVDSTILAADPLTSAWSRHLAENPVAGGERVLFLRRWLALKTGEAPSPAQAACWLDIKRIYMELRPGLRRLYTTVTELATWAPIVVPLGFAPLERAHTALGGVTYYSALLDFGEASVDGWISKLVGAELGVEADHPGRSTATSGIVTERGRLLATVLFTDIVGSTEKSAA